MLSLQMAYKLRFIEYKDGSRKRIYSPRLPTLLRLKTENCK